MPGPGGGAWSRGRVPGPEGGCLVLGGVPGPGGCLVPGESAWWRYPHVCYSVHRGVPGPGAGGAWSWGVPGPGGVPGGDTSRQLLLRAVRILLECILVLNTFLLHVYEHLNTKSSNVELNDEERNVINTVLPT